MAIVCALQPLNDDVFKKVDPQIVAIRDLLYKLVDMNNNYSNYRNLLRADESVLFILPVLFKDKIYLYEKMQAQSESHTSITERLGQWALEDSDQDSELTIIGKLNRSIIEIKKNLYDAPLEPQSDIKEQLPHIVQALVVLVDLQEKAKAKAKSTNSQQQVKRKSDQHITFFSPKTATSPEFPRESKGRTSGEEASSHRQPSTATGSEPTQTKSRDKSTRSRGSSSETKKHRRSAQRGSAIRLNEREIVHQDGLPDSKSVLRREQSTPSIPIIINRDEDEEISTLSFI